MSLDMQNVNVEYALAPYVEELDCMDNYSTAEAVGYILGVGIVGGGVAGIAIVGIKAVGAVAAAT